MSASESTFPSLRRSAFDFGNRCGHLVDQPRRFQEPSFLAGTSPPAIIAKVIDRIHDYYARPEILPTLNAVNGAERQQRSERREACVLLFSAIFRFTDLVTLRCGRPSSDDGFEGKTLKELAPLADMSLRRAERACHDLVAAGLLKVHRIAHDGKEAGWTGLAAIRSIPALVFDALGIGLAVKRERDKAAKRRRERKPAAHDPARARAALAINKALENPGAKPTSPAGWTDAMRVALRRSDRPPD